MRRFFARLANLFRRRAEHEMAREIESHLALLQEDFERRGLPPEEAALAARRAYGGVEQSKELHREARSFMWIEQLVKDVRYGWRNLLRNPGFTAVAVVSLALGIGANATIFGIYNAVALEATSLDRSSRVVRVKRWLGTTNTPIGTTSRARVRIPARSQPACFSGLTAAAPRFLCWGRLPLLQNI